jgi:beta-1,4-mannosyl-glycoprotein beta-1,4-N-acetylglucosaminyltransferase
MKNVVDYFVYFNERELLELRVNVLKDHVDKFIICEANKTHSGMPRSFELKRVIKELGLPEDKIEIIELTYPEDEHLNIEEIDRVNSGDDANNINSLRSRARERLQKNELLNHVDKFNDDCFFIISDLDEIVNPVYLDFIKNVVKNYPNNLVKVPLVFLAGRADLRIHDKRTGEPKPWHNSLLVCMKSHLKVASPVNLRCVAWIPYEVAYCSMGGVIQQDMGWHFTWMGGSEKMKEKSKAFIHYTDKFFLDNFAGKENYSAMEGVDPPYGDRTEFLKKYSIENLPKEIFNLPRVEQFLLPKEERVIVKWYRTAPAIPVIGTLIVNGVHWLERLLASVDYPVDEFVIFNNNGRDQITEELDQIAKQQHLYIKKIRVCHLPANIGCPAGWNLIIKSYLMAPYWLITNNDVEFGRGFLSEMVRKAKDKEVGVVHGEGGRVNIGDWSVFLIKDWVIRDYGLFDENFYPAYGEDVDYFFRFYHKNIKRELSVSVPYKHGDKSYEEETASQTWRTEPELKEKIDSARIKNENEYIPKKWGTGWRNCAIYKTPFNNENYSLKHQEFDLEFVRSKYIGF